MDQQSATTNDLFRASLRAGLTVPECEWIWSFGIDGRSVDSDFVTLAAQKRAELDASWEGVNRRSELLFGVSIAAIGWTCSQGRSFSLSTSEIFWCSLAFLASIVFCGLAWWNSRKPTLDLKAMLSLAHRYPASSLIAAHTAGLAILAGRQLDVKQFMNKVAVIYLVIGVISVATAIALHLPG